MSIAANDMHGFVPVVLHEGGGLIFVAVDDAVMLFRAAPGTGRDEPMELLGTVNREHAAFAAAQLTALVGPSLLPVRPFRNRADGNKGKDS